MRQANPVLGALAGAVAGIAGSWAMVRFNHAVGGGGFRPGGAHNHRRLRATPNDTDGTFSDEPASMQVASAVAAPVLGRPLSEDEKEIGGPIAHYLFGAVMGAMYGAAAETQPSATAGAGVPFGTAVWLAADEVGVPLAGLSGPPGNYPLSRHVAAFASHVVFGLTVEGVRRLLRGVPRAANILTDEVNFRRAPEMRTPRSQRVVRAHEARC
jgi:putative membrane protein